MSGTCGECEFWGWKDREPDLSSDGDRDCRLFSDWPYFEPDPPAEELPQRLAWLHPFAGADGGGFSTHSSFGCVQFRERSRAVSTPKDATHETD